MPLGGVLVLLVEDDADSRALGQAMLTRLGARVEVAEDGERGLQKMRGECPDLVLCDIRMPKLDGYEFARRVRTMPGCEQVRLVALTGLGDGTTYRNTWLAGFDAHLEKPLTVEKLNAIADRFGLGRPPSSPNPDRGT